MSRKLLAFLSALLLLLTLATYVYYRRTVAAVPVDPYALVPADAVLVLSTNDHPALVRHLQETELWDNLTAVRYFQQAAGHLALADSLAGGSARRRTGLLRLLGRKLVVTSVHVTGPGAFDVLYQVPLSRVSEYRQVRGLLETLGRDPRYRLAARDYEGQELTVLTERSSESGLTLFNYRNHLLISTNAGLVEAAVRRLAHPEAPTVLAGFDSMDLLKLRGVEGSLLINYRRLPQFLDVLFRREAHGQFDQLTGLVSQGLVSVRLAGSRVLLQGFSNPETARGALQQRLSEQPAQPLSLSSLLSTRTALLLHLAAQPARTWPRPGPPLTDSLGRHAAMDSLRATFGGEMAIGYLAAAAAGSRPGRLAFVRCPVPARTAEWLGRLRRSYGLSPAFTKVGPYQIHPVGFSEAAALGPLLGPARPGPEAAASAGVLVGSYLVLADELTLKGYLADVVAGRTWAQTPAQVAFLQETLPRARLSVLVDTRNSWNALLGILTEDRRAGLLRNEALFKRFPQLAFQLVPDENEAAPDAQYYTQLLLRHPDLGPASVQAGGAAANGRVLAFRHELMGTPTTLPALGTRIPSVVVQDSARALHFVSADNTVVWSDTLAGPAVSAAPLPAGGGGPGGLLLGAGHRLHLLAADGRAVLPFPLNLPDTVRVAALLAAPAGPAAPARLLAQTAGNALLLLDARGRLFPGWQPKQLDFPLAGQPALLSVNGRDVVVAPLQNGYVYAFDGQGNLFPGFPLSLGARLAGNLVVQAGSTLGRTHLTTVNQHGELLTFTLSGDVLSRRRVATWSRTARFRVVPDAKGHSFVITREDGNQLDVYLPNQAAPLLTQRFVTSGPKPVQFFDFGNGHRMVAVTEPGPAQVALYNGRGQLLGNAPLPSTGTGVGLTYDATTDAYQLVRIVGRELRRTEIKVAQP